MESAAEMVSVALTRGVRAAANQYGVSESTVRRRVDAAGHVLRRGRPPCRTARDAEICALASNGKSHGELGRAYHLSRERIRQIVVAGRRANR